MDDLEPIVVGVHEVRQIDGYWPRKGSNQALKLLDSFAGEFTVDVHDRDAALNACINSESHGNSSLQNRCQI